MEAAIVALDYRPNLSARNLRQGRTGLVALAVPELDNPYFAELTRHVVTAAAVAHDWTVLIDHTDGDPDREREVAAGIRDHLVDGLIFSPLALSGAELTGGPDRTPTVLLGERIDAADGRGPADRVAVDNVAAARDATAYLASLGRRRIAALGVQRHRQRASAPGWAAGRVPRRPGRRRPARADPALLAPADRWHRADGAAAMRALLAAGARSGRGVLLQRHPRPGRAAGPARGRPASAGGRRRDRSRRRG